MVSEYETYYLIAAIVTIVTGFILLTKKGKEIFNSVLWYFTRYKPKVPKETLRIIPIDSRHFWSEATVNEQPKIFLHRKFYATNIVQNPVRICKVVLKSYKIPGEILIHHPNENIFGSFELYPKKTVEIISDFFVDPKYFKKNKTKKLTIDFYDQYNNRHRVKNVLFIPRVEIQKEESSSPVLEPISSLKSELEKNVVSVLQSEQHRYKQCGRRVGGLGSIQTIYKGRTITGVGSEIREANSPKMQAIILDEDVVKINSDNADNLINYYNSIDKEQQGKFIEIVLDRLDKNKPYSDISYFIFFILFKINKMDLALSRAKEKMIGAKKYGLSELLRIIDGLLKYQPSQFTNQDLDNIDVFLVNLNEHSFSIKEKIAIIRSRNMNSGI